VRETIPDNAGNLPAVERFKAEPPPAQPQPQDDPRTRAATYSGPAAIAKRDSDVHVREKKKIGM
jgi:hypothetical protein